MLDAVVLCGGRGTRLASVVADIPKPLVPVQGRPFLDHLLAILAASGQVRSVKLAIYHFAEQFFTHYASYKPVLPVQLVREPKPLGTGGALLNALTAVEGGTAFCFNGDSLVGGSLERLYAAHRDFGPGVTIGAVQVPDASRYGSIVCDDDGRVQAFREKSASKDAGLINAGVYVLDKEVFGPYNGGVLSIETDILPRLAKEGRLRAVRLEGPFIDIGIPETYAAAADFLSAFVLKRPLQYQ
jgi:NDP-sugar pyrophosphorylase family protein